MDSNQAGGGIMDITCSKCGNKAPGLGHPPFKDDLGKLIQTSVCAGCWSEWQTNQVNVINEHRISLRDASGQETLVKHMKEFLKIS
jgi:Fe-S cluster biosynthesis and repair protein YggX